MGRSHEDLIEIRGLTKVFVTETGSHVPVFRGLDLSVAENEFVCLLGPTGCGKTTLLRTILGFEPVSGGTVRVAGRPAVQGTVPAGIVFQQNSLLPWRRVLRNVAFPLELKGFRRRAANRMAMELLEIVQLEHAAAAYPYELSGGMQQRAAIARALASETRILLMDEPFGALDDRTRRTLQESILRLWQERSLTVLFVTHNIEEALLLGSRVLVMSGGAIMEDRAVVLPRPRDRLGNDFTGQLLELRRFFAC